MALRQKIDAVIDYNLESFLDNMLNTLTFDAKFEIPEACELNDRLLSAVEKWYAVSIDASGTLLESMRFLLVLHQGFKGTEPNSYNDKIFQYIVNTAQNKIDDFRDVMLENGYLQSDLKSDKYFAEMLQYATTSKAHFNLGQFSDNNLLSIFEDAPRGQKSMLLNTFIRCAITMEFFWRKNAEAYSEYIIDNYTRYLNALQISAE